MRPSPVAFGLPLLAVVASPLCAAPPAAPSQVVAFCPNQGRVHLSWKDNATDETSYLVHRWVPETSTWTSVPGSPLPPDFEVWRGAAPSTDEQEIRLRVAAYKPGENINNLNWVVAEVLKPAGALDLFHDPGRNDPTTNAPPLEIPEGSSARVGVPFSYQIEVYGGSPERFVARDLPGGVDYDQNTGVVSGTIAAPGVYRCFVGVEFDGGKRFERAHFFRVLPGVSTPVVGKPGFRLPTQHFGVKGFLDITGLFLDPARPKGVWIYTASSSMIVALYETATPKTVNNFLGYVNRGDYDKTFVHRLASNFIFQGGGYSQQSASSPATSWKEVISRDPVQNEPGVSNTRGTIAMAKLGGTRDSATNQWFFNIDSNIFSSNASNLDFQNGGFTAFGKVVGQTSLNIVDGIGNLPTANLNDTITGISVPAFSNVPLLNSGEPTSFLVVDSIVETPPVAVELVSNSAPSVLDAAVVGTLLYIEAMGPAGIAHLRLRATNLDGNTVDFVLPIRINDILGPALRLTSIRGVAPAGTLLVRGRARDTIKLGKWRYRVNKKRWKTGGRLNGKSAAFSAKMSGFKRGRNTIEIEAFDARGNSSGVLTQRFSLK